MCLAEKTGGNSETWLPAGGPPLAHNTIPYNYQCLIWKRRWPELSWENPSTAWAVEVGASTGWSSLAHSLYSLPRVAFLWYASGAAAHIPVIFFSKAALPSVILVGWLNIMRMKSANIGASGLFDEHRKFLIQLQFTWAKDGSCFPPRFPDRVSSRNRCDSEWRWVILLHLSVVPGQ